MSAGRRVLAAWLAVVLPSLALFVHLPSRPLLLGLLNNAAHAPVFGLVAIAAAAILRPSAYLRSAARYAIAFTFAVTVGGLVEVVQTVFGRSAELRDLFTDALGAISGLALVAWCEARSASRLRRAALALVAAAAALPVFWPVGDALLGYATRATRFPVLFVAATHGDRYFLQSRGVTFRLSQLPAIWARQDDPVSLHLHITGADWPGISLIEPVSDWSGHSRLMLDLTNPGQELLEITVRVHDAAHDNRAEDRFNDRFVLAPSQRHLFEIPLAEIARGPAARRLDLSGIAGLALYVSGSSAETGREFYLTQIWLE